MTIEHAMSIEGYMEPPELFWLATQAAEHTAIVEMGSHYGRSTVALGANTKGLVYAVDDFTGPRNDGVNTNLKEMDETQIYPTFLRNTEPYQNIRPIRCDHETFAPSFFFDMVFIDGSHQYEHVKRDILKFIHTKHPVFISGHDIDFPTVRRAVDEVFGSWGQALHTSIWYTLLN